MASGNRSFYIVDAPSLIFQVFFAIRVRGSRRRDAGMARSLTTPDGRPCGAVYGFAQDMLFLLEKKRPAYLACVFDAAGPTFRDELFADYKANRPAMPEDLEPQWAMIHQLLDALNVADIELPGYEADDIAATLARQAEADGQPVVICTNDKDARQLINPLITLYDIRTDRYMDEQALRETWGIRPEQVVDFLTLVGDPVDNVPGVPGIGPKTAAELLNRYGSLDELLRHVHEVPGKRGAALREWAEKLPEFRELIRLRTDVPLPLGWRDCRVRTPDAARLAELFREWGFRRLERQWSERAIAEAATDWTVQLHYAERSPELKRCVERLAGADTIGVALDVAHGELKGLALAVSDHDAWYVPWSERSAEALRGELSRAGPCKAVYDLKSGYLALWSAGLDLASPTFDPMVADYLLDPGSRAHALGQLALRHLRMRLDTEQPAARRPPRMLWQEDHADSLARRAVAIRRLARVLREQLDREDLLQLYETVEDPLIRVLARVQQRGIRLDIAALRTQQQELARRADQLAERIYQIVGHRFLLTSPKQLRRVLFEELGLPVLRRGQTGPSTDQEVLERLAQEHEVPRLILQHRHLMKLQGYLQALPEAVDPRTGRIHTRLEQTVAATGRLISSEPNLQNIPIRSDEGRRIRRAFVASGPDWLLLDADYSQIELRILAHLSGDDALRDAFASGKDIHRVVAAELAGCSEEAVTADMRARAKAINFGIIYGMSPAGLAARTGMPEDEAAQYIERYFARHPGVEQFIERVLHEAATRREVRTILGRKRRISGVRTSPHRPYLQPEREAINTVVQGSAADLIKLAMIRVERGLEEAGIEGGIVLQVHDELLLDLPARRLSEAASIVRGAMERAMALAVPLVVDLSAGPNWLDQQPLLANATKEHA